MDQLGTLWVLHSDHLYKGHHFTLSLRLELSQTTTLSMHNPIHLIPLLSIDQLTVIYVMGSFRFGLRNMSYGWQRTKEQVMIVSTFISHQTL